MNNWEKQFDLKFTPASFTWNGDNNTGVKFAKKTRSDVKSFITSLLSQRDTELLRKIEELPEVMVDVVGINGSLATGAVKRDRVISLIKKQNK